MAVDYAVEQLTDAVKLIASSEGDLQERLQQAWDRHIQNLWTAVYLPAALSEDFKTLWERYNAPSENRFSTTLRRMKTEELAQAVSDIVDLAAATVAAHARGEQPAPKPVSR